MSQTQQSWIHAEAPDSHEVDLLVKDYGLESRFIRDALDRDEIPRVEAGDKYTYIITRFAYQKKSGDILTAPVLFALNHTKLVTVSRERLPSLQEITPSQKDATDPVLIMLKILLHIDAEYDRFIHDSSKQIRRLMQNLGHRGIGPESFIQFVHIEDDMNDFLNSLIPTNTILKHLLDSSSGPKFEKHRDLVETVILNNNQSIQTCEANLKSVDSIRRTYTLINSHNLDRTIKILTLASVFISIPTMFFSMYGMNVGLPQQKNPQAFIALMIICVVTVVSAYLVGRHKKIF